MVILAYLQVHIDIQSVYTTTIQDIVCVKSQLVSYECTVKYATTWVSISMEVLMLNNFARHVHMYTDTTSKPKYKAPVIMCQKIGGMM